MWYDRGRWCVWGPLTHIFCNMFHTGKSLSSSPTVFDVNSQESDDTDKPAAGFGGKFPPWASTCNAPWCAPQYCDPASRRFNLKAARQSSHGVRGDGKCDSCQHSVLHQEESLTSAAYRYTQVNFIIFKCTGLSVFSFLRLENEVIVDSSGIL